MYFPPFIPTAGLSAERRAETVEHPIFQVQSTRQPGRILYVKRLNGPVGRPPALQERWMLAQFALRPDAGPVVLARPSVSGQRQYLVAWTAEALQAPGAVLAPQRSV